jgi:hypothetical protein
MKNRDNELRVLVQKVHLEPKLTCRHCHERFVLAEELHEHWYGLHRTKVEVTGFKRLDDKVKSYEGAEYLTPKAVEALEGFDDRPLSRIGWGCYRIMPGRVE